MQYDDQFYFVVPRPERLSRLLIFVKWLLVLPHAFILYFFSMAVSVVSFLAWFIVLILGQYPEGMWRFVKSYLVWTARLSVYSGLLRDEYPPFGEGRYPLDFQLAYVPRSSRLLVIARIFLAIPLALWVAILGFVNAFLLIFAWFAILFTGNIPEGTFDLMVGILRYSMRVNCYLFLLTDEWPGFGLENPV